MFIGNKSKKNETQEGVFSNQFRYKNQSIGKNPGHRLKIICIYPFNLRHLCSINQKHPTTIRPPISIQAFHVRTKQVTTHIYHLSDFLESICLP